MAALPVDPAARAAAVQRRMRQTRESTYPMIAVEAALAKVMEAANCLAPRSVSLDDPTVRVMVM